jgi:hypothetical protein
MGFVGRRGAWGVEELERKESVRGAGQRMSGMLRGRNVGGSGDCRKRRAWKVEDLDRRRGCERC